MENEVGIHHPAGVRVLVRFSQSPVQRRTIIGIEPVAGIEREQFDDRAFR